MDWGQPCVFCVVTLPGGNVILKLAEPRSACESSRLQFSASIAQLVELPICNRTVAGSSPAAGSSLPVRLMPGRRRFCAVRREAFRETGNFSSSMRAHQFHPLSVALLCLAFNSALHSEGPPASSKEEKKFVTIAGGVQARSPGKVPWTPDLTLLSALSAAGGLTDLRSVTILRGKEKLTFRIKKLERNPATDPKLQPGDRIEAGNP